MNTVKPLDYTFERAVLCIARELFPQGWKASADAPDTLDGASRYFSDTGTLHVSDAHSDQTVFSNPEGNIAFRVWHDWRHIWLQAPFNEEGERDVHDMMRGDLVAWCHRHRCGQQETQRALAILEAENIGQLAAWKRDGHPPVDQRTFAMGYLAARGLL